MTRMKLVPTPTTPHGKAILKTIQHAYEMVNDIIIEEKITIADFVIVQALLNSSKPLSCTKLAVMVGCKPPYITEWTRNQRFSNRIRIFPNPEDGRGVLVELTPSGREQAKLIIKKLHEFEVNVLPLLFK